MACRLNPKFVDGVKSAGTVVLYMVIAVVVLVLYVALCLSVTYGVLNYFELYEFASTHMGNTNNLVINDISDMLLYSAKYLVAIAHLTLAIGIFGLAFIFGFGNEMLESYRYQSRELEYKFQGKKQPWYRVLLSYIIVCDGKK